VKLYDAPTRKERTALHGHKGGVLAVAFSPDGALLATGGTDKTVRLWDVEAGKEIVSLEGHTGVVRGVAFSPDGKRVVSGSGNEYPGYKESSQRLRDGEVRLWNVTA